MFLKDYLDVDKLAQHVESGLVGVAEYGALRLYNYTNRCTFDNAWDDVTCRTRGLIVESPSGEIIARPREKFFNLDTDGFPETFRGNLPTGVPIEVTDKLDGCAGTIYTYKGVTRVASRGSFTSEVAQWATTLYHKRYFDADWPKDFTPVVEIIWSGFPIVCTYPFDDIVLTGLINRETGEELPYKDLAGYANHNQMRVVELIHGANLDDLCSRDVKNKEGFVVTYHLGGCPPLKVKIKMETYKAISRAMQHASPQIIWERMREGKPLDDLKAPNLPKFFTDWVRKHEEILKDSFEWYEHQVKNKMAKLPNVEGMNPFKARKTIAEYFCEDNTLCGMLFAYYDKANWRDIIWKKIRPMGKTGALRVE